MKQQRLSLITSPHWQDYELLDSGNLKKLERFGPYRFIRPEPQAMWQPRLGEKNWRADGIFVPGKLGNNDLGSGGAGGWQLSKKLPVSWKLSYQSLCFSVRPTPFRHLGFFPEQAAHWDWCASAIKAFISHYNRSPKILNLFAYSGLASLHAAAAGAKVTHLDASKKAVIHAFENRDLCRLQDAPIRFITDDANSFVDRELRRQRRYDGIILDPPKYGRGPNGELWRMQDHLSPLLKKCRQLLSEDSLLMVLTIYAIRASSLAAHYALTDLFDGMGGTIESGELALEESHLADQGSKSAEGSGLKRFVSQANFARWQSNVATKQSLI